MSSPVHLGQTVLYVLPVNFVFPKCSFDSTCFSQCSVDYNGQPLAICSVQARPVTEQNIKCSDTMAVQCTT